MQSASVSATVSEKSLAAMNLASSQQLLPVEDPKPQEPLISLDSSDHEDDLPGLSRSSSSMTDTSHLDDAEGIAKRKSPSLPRSSKSPRDASPTSKLIAPSAGPPDPTLAPPNPSSRRSPRKIIIKIPQALAAPREVAKGKVESTPMAPLEILSQAPITELKNPVEATRMPEQQSLEATAPSLVEVAPGGSEPGRRGRKKKRKPGRPRKSDLEKAPAAKRRNKLSSGKDSTSPAQEDRRLSNEGAASRREGARRGTLSVSYKEPAVSDDFVESEEDFAEEMLHPGEVPVEPSPRGAAKRRRLLPDKSVSPFKQVAAPLPSEASVDPPENDASIELEKQDSPSNKTNVIKKRGRPRKPILPEAPTFEQEEEAEETDRGFVNNDYCEVCRETGEFVCCETCPRSFHFYCADPPCDPKEVDTMDHWYCTVCRHTKNPVSVPRGPFQKLIQDVSKMNPITFSLPDDVKMFFEGVTWDLETGNYVDTFDYKDAGKGREDTGWEEDMFPSRNNVGRQVDCFRCGLTARVGPMLSCDVCPLYWHLDCLNPPLVAPPSLKQKWKCPNHADHILRPKRKVVREKRREVLLKGSGTRNDGDVEIELDPDFPSAPNTVQDYRVTYKLPEQTIKMDFLHKLKASRVEDSMVVDHESVTTAVPASTISLDNERPTQVSGIHAITEEADEWLLGLSSFVEDVATRFVSNSSCAEGDNPYEHVNDLETLYRAALGLEQESRLQPGEPSSSILTTNAAPNLRPDDPLFQQFLAWKRLIALRSQTAAHGPG